MTYTARTRFCLALLALVSLFTALSVGQSPLAHLTVTNVRRATAAKLKGNVVSARRKQIIRYRLELSAVQGAYLLVLGPKGAPPFGRVMERIADSVVRRNPVSGRSLPESPGLAQLDKEPGARWIFLPPSAAYEWEVAAEPASTPRDMSRSVFVRKDMTSAPMELVCPWHSLH